MPHPEVSSSAGLSEIAEVLIGLGRRMRTGTDGSVLVAVARAGAHHVRGARWASVTVTHHGHFRTLAATAPVAQHADALQRELGAGPGEDVYRCGDLADRCHWPVLGARLHQRLGLTGPMSFRLHLVGEPETVAALHLYSDAPKAFGDDALTTGGLLAAHGVLAVSAQLHRRRAQHLDRALAPAGEIGTAVGVLMARYGIPRPEALDMLRTAAQDSHRPVAEIAAEVTDAEIQRLPTHAHRHAGPSPGGPGGDPMTLGRTSGAGEIGACRDADSPPGAGPPSRSRPRRVQTVQSQSPGQRPFHLSSLRARSSSRPRTSLWQGAAPMNNESFVPAGIGPYNITTSVGPGA
ncbi:ANTAR domain-containing protein [Kocuria sp. CPCC 205263]|uniref:ANTAR domain-containing protein n=1 Tax=Kocuria sp. CPCC 205263 TaxID=3073555 RepID=UPI0034D6D7F9